jgi:hypothetical protein
MKLTEYDITEHSLGLTNPTNSEIAMSFVRFHRTGLLKQTDWMSGSDVDMSEEWRTYRQALRDLPANSTPSLDENGNLTGVNWPEKPQN